MERVPCMKKAVSFLLSVCLICTLLPFSGAGGRSVKEVGLYSVKLSANSGSSSYIDNSKLIPPVLPDSQVTMEGTTPDWVKTLIMAQFRVETATREKTFDAAVQVLDHYAEMGVNGLWINPVYQRSDAERKGMNNGYGTYGPHTIDPLLTGTTDREASFANVRKFVEQAHKRNIRLFFDIVVWGVCKGSPLVKDHPDWFQRNGQFIEVWSGYGYNFSVPELREWYINAAVDFIMKTGADGFRCDLEPTITGYSLWEKVREKCYAQGRKIAIYSEIANNRHNGVYDFEQVGVGFENESDAMWESGDYYLQHNIVDSIQTGKGIGKPSIQYYDNGGMFRFYTYNLCTHDSHTTYVRGSRVKIGYQAILAPFIPMWFIGEEWNNPRKTGNVMYFNPIDWTSLDKAENRAFYEDVKRVIRIRRQYPDIFNHYPENHRDSNICKVEVEGNALQSYARYQGDTGILVIPNNSGQDKTYTVQVPFQSMKMSFPSAVITDLLTGKVLAKGSVRETESIKVSVKQDHVAVLLVEKNGPSGSGNGTSTSAKTEISHTTGDNSQTAGESSRTEATGSTASVAATPQPAGGVSRWLYLIAGLLTLSLALELFFILKVKGRKQ